MKLPYFFTVFLLTVIFFPNPQVAEAHPGNTASDGMHHCWTNCASWGEVYGQRHGHGGYSFSSTQSYNRTFTPSYTVPNYKYNSDCPSYGFAYMGSCYELPNNSYKTGMSGFDCSAGYTSTGFGLSEQCVPEVDNGYYIGTTLFCNYGYTKRYGTCVNSQRQNSVDYSSFIDTPKDVDETDPYNGERFNVVYLYDNEENEIITRRISEKCLRDDQNYADKPYVIKDNQCSYCDPGSITDTDKESCFPMQEICTATLGSNSTPVKDGECECDPGYTVKDGSCTSVSGTAQDSKSTTSEMQTQIDDLLKQVAELEKLMNQ